MGYRLTFPEFDRILAGMAQSWETWGPTRMPRCGRHAGQDVIGYCQIASISELVLDRKSFFSPKELAFPVREILFNFAEGQEREPEPGSKPILVFLRACDIHGFDRLDSVFLRNGQESDFYYERRRRLLKFVLVECPCGGFDSCFCASMGTNSTSDYAAAARITTDEVLLHLNDRELLPLLTGHQETEEFAPEFVCENKVRVTVPTLDKITPELFDDPLWKEYTRRCLGCGRCNTSCVTCSCFNMQDVPEAEGAPGARRRVWTGCHLDGFTSMAGGHECRKEYGDRMRFKTMHKINDFHRRFGKHMCVGCGRCDDVCPEYISFSRCVNRLAELTAQKAFAKEG